MSRHRSIPQLVVRPHDPRRARLVAALLVALWLASVAAAWLFSAHLAAPETAPLRERVARLELQLGQTRTELDESARKLAVYERSDQVSRSANSSLETTLREREEEIAALRADLAFYQRLVGGGRGPREGLNAHSLELRPIGRSGGYAFTLTLTQNLKKAALIEGTAELAVEGVADRQLQTLSWRELEQRADATPLTFAFKYFQQVQGNIMLPDGFTPNRIKVVVKSSGGEQAEQSFPWDQAMTSGERGNVR
jgi:hypothetical protein